MNTQTKQHTSAEDPHDALLFFWGEELWFDYLSRPDMPALRASLRQDMDAVSLAYIDKHEALLALVPLKDKLLIKRSYLLTARDFEDAQLASQYTAPYPLSLQELFLYANKYGMRDVPCEILTSINGKLIIDGGAYTGDTMLLFHRLFPQSKIFSLEPQHSALQTLQDKIQKHDIGKLCLAIQRGLSQGQEKIPLYARFANDSAASCQKALAPEQAHVEYIHTTSIDILCKHNPQAVGLIKLDIEGFEKRALEGAEHTIRKHKPVVVAAIYHNPVDFFEIKSLLLSYNSEYKFMIRRSEVVMAMADLVLIAY